MDYWWNNTRSSQQQKAHTAVSSDTLSSTLWVSAHQQRSRHVLLAGLYRGHRWIPWASPWVAAGEGDSPALPPAWWVLLAIMVLPEHQSVDGWRFPTNEHRALKSWQLETGCSLRLNVCVLIPQGLPILPLTVGIFWTARDLNASNIHKTAFYISGDSATGLSFQVLRDILTASLPCLVPGSWTEKCS